MPINDEMPDPVTEIEETVLNGGLLLPFTTVVLAATLANIESLLSFSAAINLEHDDNTSTDP